MAVLEQAKLSPAELAMRLHQQDLVAQLGLLALSGVEPGWLIDRACVVAAEGLRASMSKVLQYRPATDGLLVVAGIGWNAGIVGHAVLGAGVDSAPGYALHSGTPVRTDSMADDKRFRTPALLADHGVQSAINAPVGGGPTPYGVLEVDSTSRAEFVAADVAFVQSLANVLSAALLRAGAESAKDKLLAEKDLLMQEVHHRVKNSLQLVRTLLQLQARSATPEVKDKLDEAAQRIMTIAAVHQRLYESETVGSAIVGPYLTGLLGDMRAMLADAAAGRAIELAVEPIELLADQITPLGLIVTELVTNAAKYGQGRISVAVSRTPYGLEVSVADEGPGFADGALSTGLGMRLIRALAKGDAAQSITVDRTVPYGRVVVRMVLD